MLIFWVILLECWDFCGTFFFMLFFLGCLLGAVSFEVLGFEVLFFWV